MENINICKNCIHWEAYTGDLRGNCQATDSEYQYEKEKDPEKLKNTMFIEVSVLDDSDLSVELVTGSHFGCNRFKMSNRFYSPPTNQ